MRGATSMRRGVSLKTAAAFQGRPSRVRYSRTLSASAMLLKEMSWTIISATKRIIFQVTAIGADAQAKGNLLGGGGNLFWLGGRRGFHFALPFKGDQGPASGGHLGKISGSGEDADSVTHAINLFHGSLQDEL